MGAKLAIVFILLLSFAGCDSQVPTNNKVKGINIGVTLPLTGDLASWGERARKGIEIAVDEVNQNRAEKDKFNLIIEDTKSLPATGVSVLQKLINVNKVRFVIGDLSSGVTLAMAPVAEANKVILLAPGASNPSVRNAGEYIFRDWTSDDYDGYILAYAAKETLNAKSIVVFHQDNAYANGLADAFTDTASKIGLHILSVESFSGADSNYRTLIEKYRTSKADTFFVAAHPQQSAYFFVQARELAVPQQLIGSVAIEGEDFRKIYPNADNIYYSTVPLDPERNPKFKEFMEKYRSVNGAVPDVAAAHAYDAVLLFDVAILSAQTTTEVVRKNLLAIKNFTGATGVMSFDEKGDIKKPVALMKYEKGKQVFIRMYKPD